MRCIQTLFKFIVLIFLFCSLSLADTGTESTTDDGFSCADGETKHTGAYCDGQVCQICNVCGDDYVVEEAGEECDDNAGNDPLAQCNNDCKKTICGDELIQTPNGFDTVEQCDQGAANSNTGTCSANCQITKCGDGFTQAPNGEGETEECDDADQNNDHGECNTSCQITTCGDELLQQPNGEGVVEQCDKRDFAAGFTIESHICKTDCTAEVRNADFILKVYFRKIGTDTLIPATEAQPGTGFDYQEDFVIVYEVENLGNVALKDVAASDDRGSTVSLVNNADGDDLLSPGEKWLFETETISPELPEQFEVNALVEAYDTDLDAKVVLSRTESGYFCKDKDGDQVFCTTCVNCGNDRAKFYYEVLPTPGIEIIAYIKLNDGDWVLAEQFASLDPRVDDELSFRYDVVNTGNVPLSDINVTHTYTNGDETVTYDFTLDDRTAAGNGDNILDYQETWTYEAGPITLKEGDFSLTATVTANDPDGNQVTDTFDLDVVVLIKKCMFRGSFRHWSTYGQEAIGPNGNLLALQRSIQDTIVNPSAIPSCFAQKIGACRVNYSEAEQYRILGSCRINPQRLKALFGATEEIKTVYTLERVGGGNTNLPTLDFYYDENCNHVPEDQHSRYALCGFSGASWSPVSLIWKEGVNIHADTTLVNFKLNPYNQEELSVWKGSGDAPLLVYDPLRTGDVSSATQLFGNWTYGGKQASPVQQVSMMSQSEQQPWDHGYQALGLLDRDRNAKVDGHELNDLFLWFDYNRDASVDEGELQSVVSKGITALYYKHPQQFADSEDVGLEVGYEREVAGQLIEGGSIDWFGHSFTSKQAALSGLAGLGELFVRDNANSPTIADLLKASGATDLNNYAALIDDLIENSQQNHQQNISGFWYWSMPQDPKREGEILPGILALKEHQNGLVEGYSLVESTLLGNDAQIRSNVRVYPLQGQVESKADGQRELIFKVKDGNSNSESVTVVVINSNGHSLYGKTRHNFAMNTSRGQESVNVDYNWKARKLIVEK